MAETAYTQTPAEMEPTEPDWTALEGSAVRKEHELPWLTRLIDEAVNKGLHDEAPGREYWLGRRDALMEVRDQPAQRVQQAAEEERIAAENRRKVEEDARRIPAGSGILIRVRDSARYWFGRTT